MSEASRNTELDNKYLIVQVATESYGLELKYIKEITRMPDITKMTKTEDYIRGIIRLRDTVMPLIDIRLRLGHRSIESELNEMLDMLDQREKDHLDWLNELKSSVEEKREFTLTTDPHLCKFGQWYYSYEPDNAAIENLLPKFEQPHNKIHKTAEFVRKAQKEENFELAFEIIENTKNKELAQMKTLFKELYTEIEKVYKEFAIVFEFDENKRKAISADKIDKIIDVDPKNIDPPTGMETSNFIKGICKLEDTVIPIIDECILE